jgi:hypothetical protein
VIYTEALRAQLRAWGQEAVAQGEGQSFTAALRMIDGKMAQEPLTWGDPLYNHRRLGLVMYRAQSPPFQVHYAVDEANRIVYVRQINRVSDGPPGPVA